jgi:hypothetical protein
VIHCSSEFTRSYVSCGVRGVWQHQEPWANLKRIYSEWIHLLCPSSRSSEVLLANGCGVPARQRNASATHRPLAPAASHQYCKHGASIQRKQCDWCILHEVLACHCRRPRFWVDLWTAHPNAAYLSRAAPNRMFSLIGCMPSSTNSSQFFLRIHVCNGSTSLHRLLSGIATGDLMMNRGAIAHVLAKSKACPENILTFKKHCRDPSWSSMPCKSWMKCMPP